LHSITGTAFAVAVGSDPSGEPSGHPHQMRVVQILVTVLVPTPPPHPEPARVVPQRVAGVEHDPIHTVIRAGQQIAVPGSELIDLDQLRTVSSPAIGDQSCPEGAIASGEVPDVA